MGREALIHWNAPPLAKAVKFLGLKMCECKKMTNIRYAASELFNTVKRKIVCNCQDLVGGEGEASVFRLNYSRPPTTWTRSKPTSPSIHNDEQDFYHLFSCQSSSIYLHMSLTHSLMIVHQSERASTSDQITSNFLVNNIQLPHMTSHFLMVATVMVVMVKLVTGSFRNSCHVCSLE